MLKKTDDNYKNYKKYLNKYFNSYKGNIIWQVIKVDYVGVHVKSITAKRNISNIIEFNTFRKYWTQLDGRAIKKQMEKK